MSKLSAVIGIPKQIQLRARPSAAQFLVVRVERGGRSIECVPGQDYDFIDGTDGIFVHFDGQCVLQPDDTWDIRYLTNK